MAQALEGVLHAVFLKGRGLVSCLDSFFRLLYSMTISIHCGQRRPLAVSANTTVKSFGCFFHVKFVSTTAPEAHIDGAGPAVRLELDCYANIDDRAVYNHRRCIGRRCQTGVLMIFLSGNQLTVFGYIRCSQRRTFQELLPLC